VRPDKSVIVVQLMKFDELSVDGLFMLIRETLLLDSPTEYIYPLYAAMPLFLDCCMLLPVVQVFELYAVFVNPIRLIEPNEPKSDATYIFPFHSVAPTLLLAVVVYVCGFDIITVEFPNEFLAIIYVKYEFADNPVNVPCVVVVDPLDKLPIKRV
jgi:hypothetical protein